MRSMYQRALGAIGLLAITSGSVLAGGGNAPGGTITSGDASYSFTRLDSNGRGNWEPGGDVAGDQLFQSWWWFRADDQTSESRFGGGRPDTSDYSGDTATFTGFEESANLEYELKWKISGLTNTLESVVRVTNTTDDPGVLNIFHYGDIDLNGNQNDTATVDDDGNIFVSDAGTPGVRIRYTGVQADAFQLALRDDLLDELNDDEITNLDNTNDLTIPGDYTAGFQWRDIVLGAGETEEFRIGFTVIPAPGAAAMLGLAGLGAMRRRRSS